MPVEAPKSRALAALHVAFIALLVALGLLAGRAQAAAGPGADHGATASFGKP